MAMRILIIAQNWYPEQGTAVRRWSHLARYFISQGHTVDVIAPPPHYPGGKLMSAQAGCQAGSVDVGPDGEIIWRCNFREHDSHLWTRLADQGAVALSAIPVIFRVRARQRPDLVIASAPPMPITFSAWVAARMNRRSRRIPFVVDLRDAWPDLLTYRGSYGPRSEMQRGEAIKRKLLAAFKQICFNATSLVVRPTFNFTLRQADLVTTTSADFADILSRRGCRNVKLLRNVYSMRQGELPDVLDRPTGSLRILYAGTVGYMQSVLTAVQAVRQCRDRGVDITLRVAGGGAGLAQTQAYAERHDLPVEFLQNIPFQQVLDQYAWCDTVLITLRKWSELHYTVPSKLFEALSLNRFISGSVAGETARIIQDSQAGACVPPEDPRKLAELWESLAYDRERLNVADAGKQWLATIPDGEEGAANMDRWLQELLGAARK